jgi:hypothetical protein
MKVKGEAATDLCLFCRKDVVPKLFYFKKAINLYVLSFAHFIKAVQYNFGALRELANMYQFLKRERVEALEY